MNKVDAHGGRDLHRYTGENKTSRVAEFARENGCHFEKQNKSSTIHEIKSVI